MTEAPPSDPGQKKTLLVVDDAPTNIQVVQSILKDEYKIRVATSGEKALELVKSQPHPDLILLDVMMPGLDGYQVCERLKADPETRDIPVIFLTGRTEVDDETKGLELGALDYIRKPFSPAIVKARIRTQLLIRDSREQVNQQVQAVNHELEMARYIQLSILPSHPPAVPGVSIAARYLPMATIAGDYYDYLPVDGKHLGILIADVSGHGAPSALITSMLKIVLAEQSRHASDPAKVLGGMNDALCGKFDHHFITAAYIFLDLEKGVLRYGGAGHPPMSISHGANGSAQAIEENGLLLAQFPEETYTFVEVPFESGDRVVLNTDGVSECPDPKGEEFGTQRLVAFLDQNRDLPAEEFADAVIDALSRWSRQPQGENQHDDITLLTIDFGRP
jgi:phosphoserine phosphatase RsbU/P